MPIEHLMEGRGFDAEQTALLGAAFDVAWGALKTDNPGLENGPLTAAAREVLAKLIVDEGLRGECDAARLVENALARFREET